VNVCWIIVRNLQRPFFKQRVTALHIRNYKSLVVSYGKNNFDIGLAFIFCEVLYGKFSKCFLPPGLRVVPTASMPERSHRPRSILGILHWTDHS
jgi:hypothetical protein